MPMEAKILNVLFSYHAACPVTLLYVPYNALHRVGIT